MKFNREKADLEASLNEKQALIDEFLRQLEDQQGDADHIRRVSQREKRARENGHLLMTVYRKRMKKSPYYKQVWMSA